MSVRLENPIWRRELIAMLRGRWPVVLAAFYLAGLAGLVWFLWPAEGVYSLAAQSSRSVLLVFAVAQMLLVMLYAPAFGATAITQEKEQNSYEVLFSTQLRPWEIVAGKLGSSVAGLLLFVALGMPVFAACFFLGAVSVGEALVLLGLTVTTAVFLALTGLAISARAASSHGALVATYLVILALNVLPWLPALVLESRREAVYWTTLARAASPLAAVASVVTPAFDLGPGGRPTGLPASWRIYLGVAATGAAVALGYLVWRVRRAARQPGRPFRPVVDDPAVLARRRLRFPFYLLDPLRRRGHIPGWMNPIFAREMRAQAFGGGLWIFRAGYLCLAGSMVLMVLVAGNIAMGSPDLIRSVAVVFQLGLIVLVGPALTVGAITQELERGNLDLLRQTRLTAWQWLTGKLLTAGVFVVFVVVGALPLWFSIYYLKTNTLAEILVAWRLMGSTIGLALTAGLFGSALARRTATATGLAYGVLAVVTVLSLTPLLLGDRVTAAVRDAVLMWNPFASAIQALTSEYFSESRELWPGHLMAALTLSAAFVAVAAARMRRLLLPE